MTDSHRPRHSLDDDYNDHYDDGYDEAFVFDEPRDGEQPPAEDAKGLPVRGLAMILLAVAIILIGWGGYSLMSGNEDSGSDSTTAQEAEDTNADTNADPNADTTEASPSTTDPAPGEDKPQDSQEPAAGSNQQGQQAPNGQAGNAAPQGGVDKNNQYVAVLNNSRVQGLAGDVAGKLGREDWKKTGVGNLPGQSATFPSSVVLYPRGDAQAKATAETVARDLGIKAEERTPAIDQAVAGATMLEGPPPGGVVVITTNDMPR